ncbi:MAG: DinB family protein [Gemmatimonadetes bacterium]|nr:DinB family protein [Gemmatimonadota bacterium]NNL29494.1 DinB family protein [Gemmatimonadota bacterium]
MNDRGRTPPPELEDILGQYASVRRRTRAVADCIPEIRLEYAPGPGRFTPGDILRHIGAAERWMWAENVRLRPSRYPGHGPELAAGKAGVIGYLARMQDETAEIISGLTPSDLERRCKTVGGAEITVWKWIRLMFEHQIHHRGQLYEILGGLEVATPPLYGLQEPEVRARSLALE